MANQLSLREQLLQIMDQKHHWGWSQLTGPEVTKSQMLIHFQQEYEVYVRDFPILLSRVLGRFPEHATLLRREFAENIFEEQTGGLSLSVSRGLSHPELFEKMMLGLGYKKNAFTNIALLPTSFAYRCFLDLVTFQYEWPIAASVLTLFVEGSIEDRARLKIGYKPTQSLDKKMKSHSLFLYHGLKMKDMDLVRVHHAVEGDHRRSAWDTLLKLIPPELEPKLIKTMQQALDLWLLFRDGVCLEMGLQNRDFMQLAQQEPYRPTKSISGSATR